MRTFIIADVHGYPGFIINALEHGEFRSGRDAFVYAGDFLDRGPDPQGCLRVIERYATDVLFGNHEAACLLDFAISGRDPDSRSFRQVLLDRLLGAGLSRGSGLPDDGAPEGAAARTRGDRDGPAVRSWRAVMCIEGVLVSHAGVSEHYRRVFWRECGGDPRQLAERLDREFLDAARRELETGEWQEEGVLADHGPLWFRPKPFSRLDPLGGVRQVAGHTPPLRAPSPADFHMIDPCAFFGMRDEGAYRYAVIEEGQVRMEDGTLSASGPGRRRFGPAQRRDLRHVHTVRRRAARLTRTDCRFPVSRSAEPY